MRKRPFEAPAGEGVIAWLYMEEGYLAANVMAPTVKSQLGRLMIQETVGLLGEDAADWTRLIGPEDAEASEEKKRTLDAGINFTVAFNLISWEDKAAIRNIESNLDALLAKNCTPSLEEFADAFAPFPDHSRYGTLLGVKHLFERKMLLTTEYWWARKLHLKWAIKAYQLWGRMSAEHSSFIHRDVQLEIYLDQKALIVREKNLSGEPPDLLSSPNIMVFA